MRIAVVAAALFLLADNGSANPVDDLFGDGLLGVSWTDSLESVESVHPDGSHREFSEFGTTLYDVRDDRAIFEIERRRRNTITFGFDTTDSLRSVSVQFPDCSMLMARVTEVLGSPAPKTAADIMTENQISTLAGKYDWPSDSGNVSASILMTTGFASLRCELNIAVTAQPETRTLEDLGLN